MCYKGYVLMYCKKSKVEIYKDNELKLVADDISHAAEYIGENITIASDLLREGGSINGFSLEHCEDGEKMGDVVLAITSNKIVKYNSFRACSRAFNIPRTKLVKLIESGGTADDGRTTFDVPFILGKKEEGKE